MPGRNGLEWDTILSILYVDFNVQLLYTDRSIVNGSKVLPIL